MLKKLWVPLTANGIAVIGLFAQSPAVITVAVIFYIVAMGIIFKKIIL